MSIRSLNIKSSAIHGMTGECPCGWVVLMGEKKCGKCGAALAWPKECPKCGTVECLSGGKKKPPTANQITAALLIEIPKRFPGRIWVYRNNRLEADAIGKGGRTRHVSAGINGQGDLSGVVTVEHAGRKFGLRLEVEIKAGRDRMSPVQMAFQSMILGMGSVYILARDVDECLLELAGICAS